MASVWPSRLECSISMGDFRVFISHASEDTDTVARPLAERLQQRGVSVWLDQWELKLGDGLRQVIEDALSGSTFGVVIVSPDYMRKLWTNRELDGLFSLERVGRNVVLPVLHNVRWDEFSDKWPILAGRLGCSTDRGLDAVADQIALACRGRSTQANSNGDLAAVSLDGYRRRMIEAVDHRSLSELGYELDDFLRRYPGHPQARLLLDQVKTAADFYAAAPPRREGSSIDRVAASTSWLHRHGRLAASAALLLVFSMVWVLDTLRTSKNQFDSPSVIGPTDSSPPPPRPLPRMIVFDEPETLMVSGGLARITVRGLIDPAETRDPILLLVRQHFSANWEVFETRSSNGAWETVVDSDRNVELLMFAVLVRSTDDLGSSFRSFPTNGASLHVGTPSDVDTYSHPRWMASSAVKKVTVP